MPYGPGPPIRPQVAAALSTIEPVPASKPRKKKPARTASRSGNPAARRAERESAEERRVSRAAWQHSDSPFGEYRRQLDRQRMKNASYDAEPIVADLLSLDGTVDQVEDALCRMLGETLAEQDQVSDAALARSQEVLGAYSPDQLLQAVTDIAVREARRAVAVDGDPQTRDAAWQMQLAICRITPYPAAELTIAAGDQLRAMATPRPDGDTTATPQGPALWCRDAYGTRFAITAPFATDANTPTAGSPARWYLWDIDACGSDAYTVGAGYFPDADAALAAWRAAAGTRATAGAVLEPVTDPYLAARLLPGLPAFFHPGGENQEQYAEFHRCRRLAQALRSSKYFDGSATGSGPASPPAPEDREWFDQQDWDGKDQWIGEFAAWRAMHRPGARAIPEDFPIVEGADPLTENELYRELLSSWFTGEFPEFAYCCSPHRIALLHDHLTDFYDDDFAQVITGLVPDLVAWLSEQATLPADLVPQPAADTARDHLNPLDRVQE